MALLICSKCGKHDSWYAGRGMKIGDIVTRCCRAKAAKGHMITLKRNNLQNEWLTEKHKVYKVAGNAVHCRAGEILPEKIVDGEVWCAMYRAATHEFRPAHVPADYVEYYRIPVDVWRVISEEE